MNPIINTSVFVGEINLPGIDKPSVKEKLEGMIRDNQSSFLKKVLGYALYWKIKKAFEDSEKADPIPLPEKVKQLFDGIETEEYDHVGIKKLYSYWIYDFYQGKIQTESGTTGETSSKKTNAYSASVIYKMCDVWNKMCEEAKSVVEFLNQDYFFGLTPEIDIRNRSSWCCYWKNNVFQKKNWLNI